jgi:WD40 repeat protein
MKAVIFHALALTFLAGRETAVRSWQLRERPAVLSGKGARALSPDGKSLVWADDGNRGPGTCHICDTATARETRAFQGPEGRINALAFTPDGTKVAVLGDEDIRLYDAASGKETSVCPARSVSAYRLSLSSDGKRIGIAGSRVVRTWDTGSGKELSSWNRPIEYGTTSFDPELKTLAAANYPDVDLFDAVTGKERAILGEHRGAVRHLAFAADGRTLAVVANRFEPPNRDVSQVTLWDVTTGKVRVEWVGEVGSVNGMTLHPDARTVILVAGKNTNVNLDLILLDVPSGKQHVLSGVKSHGGSTPLLSRDGKVLAYDTGTGSIRLWDVVPAE